MNILSIDVGLHLGWSMSLKFGRQFDSGEIDFTATQHNEAQSRSYGKLFNDLEQCLTSKCISHDIELIGFEIIAIPYKSLMVNLTTLGMIAVCYKVGETLGLNIMPISSAQLHKFALGKKTTNKSLMIAALKRAHKIHVSSIHEANAIWVTKYIEEQI